MVYALSGRASNFSRNACLLFRFLLGFSPTCTNSSLFGITAGVFAANLTKLAEAREYSLRIL